MFTGIIETTAGVLSAGDGKLTVERPSFFDDVKVGSSIAVDGVCLTIISLNEKKMGFDLTEETLACSTLGSKNAHQKVNLERSLLCGARIEGHTVQGHVEGTAEVAGFERNTDDSVTLMLRIPEALMPCVIPKGSITIDGASLTIASVEHNNCSIALIPHTQKITTLGNLEKGMRVNVETDILVRTALHR